MTTNTTRGPLRKVVIHDWPERGRIFGTEQLECGHEVSLSSGWSYAASRRCKKCQRGAPRDFQSFAGYVTTPGDNGHYTSNAMRFATLEEAKAYVEELASRWLAVKDFCVDVTTDPVNYVWSEGRAVRLEEGTN